MCLFALSRHGRQGALDYYVLGWASLVSRKDDAATCPEREYDRPFTKLLVTIVGKSSYMTPYAHIGQLAHTHCVTWPAHQRELMARSGYPILRLIC